MKTPRLGFSPSYLACVIVVGAVMGCGEAKLPAAPNDRVAPPLLAIDGAASFLTPVGGGATSLLVSAVVTNPTTISITVDTGAACPLGVSFAADPTGSHPSSLAASQACGTSGSFVALAPGDTLVLTRILGTDSLAQYMPGVYSISVAATTSAGLIGTWAGDVQLPAPGSH